MEDQEALGRLLAGRNHWKVIEVFGWIHSGRKTEREDFEEVLTYIKKSKVKIHHYITKGLDRFTRLGVPEYLRFKAELENLGVQVWDTEGIIQPKKNFLEDLGDWKYDWAYYSPSESAEVSRAQDAKDDARKTITRLIRAEIRLVQTGYLTRRPTDGYILDKIFLENGKKKNIGKPDPERAKYYLTMFKMRAAGDKTDEEIVAAINAMGFKSKIMKRYTKVRGIKKFVGYIGGNQMTVKQMQRNVQKTIYAGVVCEKWTNYKPIKAQFDGLISIDLFNRANQGKIFILELDNGDYQIVRNKKVSKKRRHNPDYPYHFIPCHLCKRAMLYSSPVGKSGKGFPTYHCGGLKKGPRTHKYWGVPKELFNSQIKYFAEHLEFTPAFLTGLEEALMRKYYEREREILKQSSDASQNVAELLAEQATKIEAFSQATSPTLRAKLQEQVDALEGRIKSAREHRDKLEIDEGDIKDFIREARCMIEHPSYLLLDNDSLEEKLAIWGLAFDELPTYTDVLNGTPKYSLVFQLSKDFEKQKSPLVTPTGFEPVFAP